MKKDDRQTCLVTGGAGFIGSHLVDWLLEWAWRVLVIDDLSTGKFQNIERHVGDPLFSFVEADVCDRIALDRFVSKVDIVVHLAAAVGVELIVDDPVRTIETNVGGTEAVLQSCRRYRTPVIVASTSEVYGKSNKMPFAEDDDLVLGSSRFSRWAYATSKLVDEHLALAYARQYGLPVTIVRLFNTVGPRQSGQYGMVVPRLVRQALAGEDLTVYGDGSQSRCFCHVYDTRRALGSLMAAPRSRPPSVFNVGHTQPITILDLARMVIEQSKSKSQIRFVPYDEAYGPGFEDMMQRAPDTSRIREELGWQPMISLEDIVEDVIRYESHQKSS